jgi:hypothetical protein
MDVSVANNKQLKKHNKYEIDKVLFRKVNKTREQFKI